MVSVTAHFFVYLIVGGIRIFKPKLETGSGGAQTDFKMFRYAAPIFYQIGGYLHLKTGYTHRWEEGKTR